MKYYCSHLKIGVKKEKLFYLNTVLPALPPEIQKIIQGNQGAPEFTQVFQSLFPPPEGTANRKHQREDHGNADQRKINIKIDPVMEA